MKSILDKLRGGDLRSIGRTDEVVQEVLNTPTLFDELFNGMRHDDPHVRMRAADAVEKITAKHPEWLGPYKSEIIRKIARLEQQEVRWHVAQMIPRLELTEAEREKVFEILLIFLKDKSNIVKTFSMQALADLAEQDKRLCARVVPIIEELSRTGSPAVKSRGGKLLSKLRHVNIVSK